MIIGTAGHIDHGKTTLIKALTGFETDRLAEEKKRGISIDLGFAEFKLPSGIIAGVVDVPGHERFIKNMLAGATGLDLVLLVIASDDGIMPQTEEHLSIIKLLGVKKVIVALTKADLVEKDWQDLVIEEVREFMEKNGFKDTEVIPVSSVTKKGVDKLLASLDKLAQEITERDLESPFRLPIDRVFTITGAGTIITGTLWEGKVQSGETVEIKPGNLKAKVRSIQVHNHSVEQALAGQRVALNLTGIEKEELTRGQVILAPGYLSESRLIDIKLELLPEWKRNLKNRERIRFHHGTLEVMGRVVLLDRKELEPSQSCLARVYLEDSIIPKFHDRFVIRSYSPLFTIGGGKILNSHPVRRRRNRQEHISELEKYDEGLPEEVISLKIAESEHNPMTLEEIISKTELKDNIVSSTVINLVDEGILFKLDGNLYFSAQNYSELARNAGSILSDFHERETLSKGLNKETFKSKLYHNQDPARGEILLAKMVKDGLIGFSGEAVFSPEFKTELSKEDSQILDKIISYLSQEKFAPPELKNLASKLGLESKKTFSYMQILRDRGDIVQIKGDLYFTKKAFDDARAKIIDYIQKNDSITPAEFRDLLQTTRKYIVPLLEYFDSTKLTIRQGDKRILR